MWTPPKGPIPHLASRTSRHRRAFGPCPVLRVGQEWEIYNVNRNIYLVGLSSPVLFFRFVTQKREFMDVFDSL